MREAGFTEQRLLPAYSSGRITVWRRSEPLWPDGPISYEPPFLSLFCFCFPKLSTLFVYTLRGNKSKLWTKQETKSFIYSFCSMYGNIQVLCYSKNCDLRATSKMCRNDRNCIVVINTNHPEWLILFQNSVFVYKNIPFLRQLLLTFLFNLHQLVSQFFHVIVH